MKAETEQFRPEQWYERLIGITNLNDSKKRYGELTRLHAETVDFYVPTIRAIDDSIASQISSDGRPKSLVVAHIMGWEEWQIQAFTDPNRLHRLTRQMGLQDYFDDETRKTVSFKGVDDFNKYQANKYAQKSWNKIQEKAISTALTLQGLFPPTPSEEWLSFLENTPPKIWRMTPTITVTVPGGIYLWMVSLEHEAVEHRKDLI